MECLEQHNQNEVISLSRKNSSILHLKVRLYRFGKNLVSSDAKCIVHNTIIRGESIDWVKKLTWVLKTRS